MFASGRPDTPYLRIRSESAFMTPAGTGQLRVSQLTNDVGLDLPAERTGCRGRYLRRSDIRMPDIPGGGIGQTV